MCRSSLARARAVLGTCRGNTGRFWMRQAHSHVPRLSPGTGPLAPLCMDASSGSEWGIPRDKQHVLHQPHQIQLWRCAAGAGDQKLCPFIWHCFPPPPPSSSGLVVLNFLSGKSYPAAMRDYDSDTESYHFLEGNCEEAKVISMEKSLFRYLGAGALVTKLQQGA